MRRPPSVDLCVIGASEAGVAACVGAAALGLSVTLVDDGDPSGMRNPDLVLEALREAALAPRHPGAWPNLQAPLRRAAAERRHARLAAMNIRVVAARARFGDHSTVMAGSTPITARRILLAVGGRQPSASLATPLGPGHCLTVSDLARLDALPGSLAVLGGGREAVAAAQSLQRLGTRAMLATDRLLPDVDEELAAPLLVQLARDGVTLRTGARPQLCQPAPDGIVTTFPDGARFSTSHLLLAEEPVPALEGLDLECAGIAQRSGRLVLDRQARTTNRRVFALGRTAGAASTAAGVAQVGHVLQAAFLPGPARSRPEEVAVVTATHPQIGTVGLSEPVAARAGPVRVWRWPLSQTGPGAIAQASGLLKVVTNRRGEVLGAGLVGADVREMLPFWSLAVARRLTLSQLADVAIPTPSFSEAARALAVSHLAARLGHPIVRRAVRLARWFD